MQNPEKHCPLGPHWSFVAQVPHVPPTQASPPPHWLFAVHALQTPSMHANPLGTWGWLPKGALLQSANVAQAPHTPAMQAWPVGQELLMPKPPQPLWGAAVQMPELHISSDAQPASPEHVH